MRPQFLDPLDVRATEPNLWTLLQPFSYRSFVKGNHIITPQKGFVNDLASIPRAFRWLFNRNGLIRCAAVIHDWLYRHKGIVDGMTYTRKECDQVLLEGMKVKGISRWTRYPVYWGVRAGGWVAF